MSTNVPTVTFGAKGFSSPTSQLILTGVQADLNAAFGGNLNPALNTPQGQLASSETAIITQANNTFLAYCNLVDPAYSYGRMQNAIGRIYDIWRIGGTATTVNAQCGGLQGVVIPIGALASDTSGNIYSCTTAGTIDASGTITLPFACTTIGPIACPAGALNKIYQSIPGWDTISNAAAGVTGQDTEDRNAFELRRYASVAKNAVNSLSSIVGSVLAVPGVSDAFIMDNRFASPLTIGNVTLEPNSLYVAVVGGVSTDIAAAIWSKRPPGIAFTGNTTVQVANPPSVNMPPAYVVKYQIPVSLPVMFALQIVNLPSVPANAESLIQNAIANVPALITGSIAGNVLTVTGVLSGIVEVGQTIVDGTGSIAQGTVITSLGTGSGGIGTYNLNNAQTIASENMTAQFIFPSTHIGQKILASQYYPRIAGLWPGAQIISLLCGSTNTASASFTGSISDTTLAVSAVSSGILAIGQMLFDTLGNLTPGTTIVNLISGAGGVGTYQVSQSQTVASEAMQSVIASGYEVNVGIDQSPVISPQSVLVSFL